MPAPSERELVVLGAGPAYTDRLGATGAAYLVRRGDDAILLDLGQGSFPRLMAELEPSRLHAIVVSHLHPDHFIDLVSLRHYLVWERRNGDRVRVFAPAGLADRIDALHATPGFTAAAFDVEVLAPGTFVAGPFSVTAARVTHTEDSYGFRVSQDGTGGLAYSGDCARAQDLDPLVRPDDTLLVEASFGPGPSPEGGPHLDGIAVGELAHRTRPSRVLLTHIQMGYDGQATVEAVRQRYGGPVDLVEPGDRTAF